MSFFETHEPYRQFAEGAIPTDLALLGDGIVLA
jgi:hypothetical protein